MSQDKSIEGNHPEDEQVRKSVEKRPSVEEYRLVPIEEYGTDRDEDVIDIIGILKDLWMNRKFIYRVTLLFLVAGLLIFIFSDRIYYSEAKLMPESSTETSQLGQIFQQAENIFGIQRRSDDDGIRVAMYPYIVESLPFQIELMQQEVYFSDIEQRITIFDYFTNHYEEPFFTKVSNFLWDYTFGLPVTLRNAFSERDDEISLPEAIDFSQFMNFDEPILLDSEIRKVANTVKNLITISREAQSGFISIGVSFMDAPASTEMVILVKSLLQEYVIDYRTEKAMNNLMFIEQQFEDAKANFQRTQEELANFQDQNINVQRQSVIVQEERLQFEAELAFALYNNIGRRLQEAKIQVQEETPVFRIHEPAVIPTRPAHPKASRILGGSLFVGLFLGVSLIYFRRGYWVFMDKFEKKEISHYRNKV